MTELSERAYLSTLEDAQANNTDAVLSLNEVNQLHTDLQNLAKFLLIGILSGSTARPTYSSEDLVAFEGVEAGARNFVKDNLPGSLTIAHADLDPFFRAYDYMLRNFITVLLTVR